MIVFDDCLFMVMIVSDDWVYFSGDDFVLKVMILCSRDTIVIGIR